MDLVTLQENLFTFSSLLYLVATFCYLAFVAGRSVKIGKVATWVGLIGVVIHTVALIVRWVAAGIDHPPFTNLYESLVFFGWGIVAFYLYMEWRYKVRIAGAFVFPIALAAMGIAVSHQKGIMPLPDALQSWWLHVHVMFAAIAYAAFVVAFAFSLIFLIKDRVSRSVFGLVVSLIVSLILILIQLRAGFSHIGAFFLKKAAMHGDRWVPVAIRGTNPPEYHTQMIPGVGPLFLVTAILLAVAAIAFIVHLSRDTRASEKAGGYIMTLATGIFTAALLIMAYFGITMPDVALRIEPFLVTLLVFLGVACWGVVLLYFRGESLIERLPPVDTLDFLSYRSVVVAFPLMTIVIVTGAVWAQSAWGRWWGWDPKETASLVTWIVYAAYLHMRVVAGWKDRPAAVINIIGFLSVIFTYLGVNVFLSGLHSYAKGF